MIKLIEERVRKTKIGYKLLFYGSMGMLWSLANIGYSFGFLTWFALVPLLFLLRFETIKRSIFFSSIFGFVFYITNFYWLANPFIMLFGNSHSIPMTILGAIIGGLVAIVVSFYHGLSFSLAVFFSKYLAHKKGELFYVVFPIMMTAIDYFFPKLWHDQIGYSQYIFMSFSQIADIFGVPIITLIVLSCNASIIMIVENAFFRKSLHASIIRFICVICIIITCSIYGYMRMDNIAMISENAPKAKIGIVQGNFSGLDKRNKEKRALIIPTYNELSESITDQSPDLIVWPESSTARTLSTGITYFDTIKTFYDCPLLFGSNTVYYDHENMQDKLYNSLYLVNHENQLIDRYDKIKLLPLTEDIPLPGMKNLMRLYGLQPFTSGDSQKIFDCGQIRFSPNICYEDIIDGFVRKSLKNKNGKSNLIINCTNDSWFGRTSAPKMHMHISIFRAIENKRALVRATCTGHSVICDPVGQILRQSNLNEQDAFVEEVALLDTDTIYGKGGWMFVYLLALLDIILLLYRFFGSRYARNQLTKTLMEKRHKEKLYQTWMD